MWTGGAHPWPSEQRNIVGKVENHANQLCLAVEDVDYTGANSPRTDGV